jgi:hypothetical protein
MFTLGSLSSSSMTTSSRERGERKVEILLIGLWLLLSIIVGAAARARGRDPGAWFILAVVVSPLLAVLLLIAFPVREKSERQQPKGYLPWHKYFASEQSPASTKHIDPRWANLRSEPPINEVKAAPLRDPEAIRRSERRGAMFAGAFVFASIIFFALVVYFKLG